MKHIRTAMDNTGLDGLQHSKVTDTIPLAVHHSEATMPRAGCRALAQLGTSRCPLLRSYLNKVDDVKHPTHLFNCTNKHTTGHGFVNGVETVVGPIHHFSLEGWGQQQHKEKSNKFTSHQRKMRRIQPAIYA